MGGFSSVLGHVAAGFENARQQDLQRQFEDVQNRRALHMQLLTKLMGDETVAPEVRNWAMGEAQKGATAPLQGKKWEPDWKGMPTPANMQSNQPTPQPTQTSTTQLPPTQPLSTPPPTPPGGIGPQQTAIDQFSAGNQTASRPGAPMPQMASFTPPPTPPQFQGAFMSPEAHTALQASRAGATTGAELGGQIDTRMQTLQDHPELLQNPIAASLILTGTVPFGLAQSGLTGTSSDMTMAEARLIPALSDLLPTGLGDDATVKVILDRAGRPSRIVPTIMPSLLPKTTTGSTTTPGGLTTTNKKTVTPQMGQPPAPPSGGTTAAPTAKGGTGKGKPSVPPQVEAEMDRIRKVGLPQTGALSPAEARAEQALRRQGVNVEIASTMATRSMGDKAQSLLPMIQHARELIAANPDALGPIAGRWSDLENKAGSLEGPAKELAGTLTSIYSIAGGMHGWRSIKVADEFEKKYGTLSNNPKSLNSGLDALASTANNIMQAAYPGGKTIGAGGAAGAPPTPPRGPVRFEDAPLVK